MSITSSSPGGSSCTTEATRTRAEAPPMAPASCVSAKWTRSASAGSSSSESNAAPPRVREERLARPLRPEEAPGEGEEILHRGAAAPEPRAIERVRVLEDVHEQGRLAGLRDPLPRRHRHAHVEADVGEHAPEQGVRDLVHAREAEELLRLQQRDAEEAVGEEARGQPARLGEGGQEQRVPPHRETGGEARERAGAGGAAPVDAAEDRRRELRHRGEGDEADRDERVRLAGHAEVDVARGA